MNIHIDSNLCRGCEACMLACSTIHEGVSSPSLARLAVSKDMAQYEFNIVICQHCTMPDCLPACPSGAIIMDKRGVAILQQDKCMQCGLCAESCPYGAIRYHPTLDRYMKCDLCAGFTDGLACVDVCPVEALTLRFGLNDGGE